MFLDFYRLRQQPFGDTPDPRFLYLSKTHCEALASLFYGIESGRGFLALIAGAGLGKTTLLFQLLDRLQHSSRTVFLSKAQGDSREFLRYLLAKLGIETQGRDLADLHNALDGVLDQETCAGRRFVLVIDEAQELGDSVLETVRLLSAIETPQTKKLQIVLSGQPPLADKLANPGLAQLRQRISILGRLGTLNLEDTARYIEHRLRVAGREGRALFTSRALKRIAEVSHGIPRNINNLCFGALSVGYALEQERIDVAIIDEVAADLDMEAVVRSVRTTQTQVSALSLAGHPSHAPNGRGGFAARAIGASVLAAALVVAGGYAFSSPEWLHWSSLSRPSTSPIRTDLATAASQLPSSQSEQKPLAIDPQPPDPNGTLRPVRLEDPARKVITIVVEPKQTLRQICLRNIGRFNNRLVEKIQELNPWMQDPNDLKVGQKVQLPVSAAGTSGQSTAKPTKEP